MNGLIPSAYYHDQAVLSVEYERLFSRTWYFVGFTSDLSENNDYISAEVAGKSILVQNFEGELRAYLNVCSHRFCKIRCDRKGNGPLRCPYHGWTYDAEGVPVGIPSRPRFEGLTDAVIRSLALQSFRVEVCGTLVFVALDLSGPSLRQFLGAAWNRVEMMTTSFGEMIDRNELEMECNWKIAVENTLESYHVTFVHPKTFKMLGASGTDFQFEGMHSVWYANVSESVERQMAKLQGTLGSRPFKVTGYLHQLVFPNLTIATTYGNSFAVQQIVPRSASSTSFTSYVFETKLPSGGGVKKAVRNMVNESVVEFNRAVFSEDKTICEAVQCGIRNGSGAGQLSDEELRVAAFQKHYAATMALSTGSAEF